VGSKKNQFVVCGASNKVPSAPFCRIVNFNWEVVEALSRVLGMQQVGNVYFRNHSGPSVCKRIGSFLRTMPICAKRELQAPNHEILSAQTYLVPFQSCTSSLSKQPSPRVVCGLCCGYMRNELWRHARATRTSRMLERALTVRS
jgi:hypothetical protein